MSFSFPRSLRLLNKKQYDYVFQSAIRVGAHSATVLYRKNSLEHPRLGLIVAKKTAKRAHDRNRFKRITRESFRLAQHELPSVDIVVLSRGKIDTVGSEALWAEFKKIWMKVKP